MEAHDSGLSLERLQRVAQYVQRQVDEEKAPMMQLMIARHGKVVFTANAGFADRERQTPLTDRTLVRMFSNTKMVVSVAVMMLVERAALHLDFLVEDYLPCFADMQVCTGQSDGKIQTRPAKTKMTVQHLLTHTSGLTYGFFPSPVAESYGEAAISFDPALPGLSTGAPDEPGDYTYELFLVSDTYIGLDQRHEVSVRVVAASADEAAAAVH